MAAEFALSWDRPQGWAVRLGKPQERAVSQYHSRKYDEVERTAAHINSIGPEFDCKVEVITS